MARRDIAYLGDGVYIQPDPQLAGGYILTTSNHDPRWASNTIYLDTEVLEAIKRYMAWADVKTS